MVSARPHTNHTKTRLSEIWDTLELVVDPELPTLSILDIGIVRRVELTESCVRITITPTYSGCPAMETIRGDIVSALTPQHLNIAVITQLAPAWTTDWIRPSARAKLRALGIAPPCNRGNQSQVIGLHRPAQTEIACPLCESTLVEQLAHFSSTACKALYRCLHCREPFDYFKPI